MSNKNFSNNIKNKRKKILLAEEWDRGPVLLVIDLLLQPRGPKSAKPLRSSFFLNPSLSSLCLGPTAGAWPIFANRPLAVRLPPWLSPSLFGWRELARLEPNTSQLQPALATCPLMPPNSSLEASSSPAASRTGRCSHSQHVADSLAPHVLWNKYSA